MGVPISCEVASAIVLEDGTDVPRMLLLKRAKAHLGHEWWALTTSDGAGHFRERMHMPRDSKSSAKPDRLIAAHEFLGEELAGMRGQAAENTRNVCLGARPFIADARSKHLSVRPSQIATVLEKGLRECGTQSANNENRRE